MSHLTVSIQGHQLIVSVYVLPVSGDDMILVFSWLATLGPHIVDYATSTLKFFQNDKFIILQGTPIEGPHQAQPRHIQRMHKTQAIAECFTIQLVTAPELELSLLKLPAEIKPKLAPLQQNHQRVFQTPQGLPPTRDQDHAIPLQEGAQPVKVRPYRYPHSQKEQIEKWYKKCLNKTLYTLAIAHSLLLFC